MVQKFRVRYKEEGSGKVGSEYTTMEEARRFAEEAADFADEGTVKIEEYSWFVPSENGAGNPRLARYHRG